MLSPSDLLALIHSDSLALEHFNLAQDAACATRCSSIAPKLQKELRLSELGILNLYQSDLQTGILILERIKDVAPQNKLVEKIKAFMQPGTNPESYPDLSNAQIRIALTADIPYGLGLTIDQARPILEAGEQMQIISPVEVEYVRTRLQWQQ